ncbi:hypothetical protein G6F50_012883 [Rhizopus delemar]|uniref:HPt domain-containing protein n=1 Tax=Rhizopus delemar TaxID=936053 RepID=A0A9P6YQR9_9FUNG|nr:hypothetical protein G6F50_012883 [Rhizopus delemar]
MSMDLQRFHATFFEESREGLDAMEAGLLALESGQQDAEIINSVFRAAHSIKGGAGTFGFDAIAGLTHVLETLLDELRAGKRALEGHAVDAMLPSVDVLRALLRDSQPLQAMQLPGPQSRQIMRELQQKGIALRFLAGNGTPFALCRPQPQIILPAASLALPDRTLRLVIGHEAAHLQRRDPQRAALMRLVGALYWFNPFVRRIAARVQLAAELQCDARALAEGGASNDGRLLAHAYIQTLRHATGEQPASALTHRDFGGHQLRLQHMLQGDAGRRPGITSVLLLVALGAACTVGLATVQAAAMAGPPSLPLPLPVTSVTVLEEALPPAPSFAAPLSNTRVTSVFGHVSDFRQRAHRGTDFAARRGTAVLAPADGTVIAATHAYPDGANYGTVVVIDHGAGWQSLFAHLQDFAVQPGQRVRRGDPIARSGNTGRTTGPHLHMELLRNGTRVDPQDWLQ